MPLSSALCLVAPLYVALFHPKSVNKPILPGRIPIACPARLGQNGQNVEAGAVIELRQPLVNPAQQFYTAPAAERAAEAAASTAASERLANAIDAVSRYLDALEGADNARAAPA